MKRAVAVLVLALFAGCSSASSAERLDARGRREKKPERAIDLFTQAIELEPQRAEFFEHRGDARAKQGDDDGAIADYTESLHLEPSARAHLHRARARRRKKQFDLALADVEAAAELDPDFEASCSMERQRIREAMSGKKSD